MLTLLILVTAICTARNAASCCGVSTPFKKAFPMCLTDSFKFIFPSLASLQALSMMALMPFCALVTYANMYSTMAYRVSDG